MTLKRRYLISAAVLATCVCAAWIVLALLPIDNEPGVTKANLDRIQNGMTWEQVKEILGDNHEQCGIGRPWAFTEVWTGNAGQLAFVSFRSKLENREIGQLRVVHTEWRGSLIANLERTMDCIRRLRLPAPD